MLQCLSYNFFFSSENFWLPWPWLSTWDGLNEDLSDHLNPVCKNSEVVIFDRLYKMLNNLNFITSMIIPLIQQIIYTHICIISFEI